MTEITKWRVFCNNRCTAPNIWFAAINEIVVHCVIDLQAKLRASLGDLFDELEPYTHSNGLVNECGSLPTKPLPWSRASFGVLVDDDVFLFKKVVSLVSQTESTDTDLISGITIVTKLPHAPYDRIVDVENVVVFTLY